MNTLRIDAPRFLADLDQLAAFGADAAGGVTRVAYSAPDLRARDWVDERLREAGLIVRRDVAGNTIARREGATHARAIAIGSHTDTVPNGGRFDGALGVMAALAVARALRDAGVQIHHALEVINFMAEEATMSGGTTGSQMMAGLFDPAQFDQAAWDGQPVRAHLSAAGLAPDDWRLAIRRPEAFAAFLELHIEQGDALLHARKDIGVVEGLVGIRRYRAAFEGTANHAGTTTMQQRDDALIKAAPFVQHVRDVAVAHGIVGTVGVFNVHPGAPNVIPGRVDMVIELRALDVHALDAAAAELRQAIAQGGGSLAMTVDKPPVKCDATVIEAIQKTAHALGLSTLCLPSGAFHDAANMAALCPAGMIFVPSQGGISHAPEEATSPGDCVAGANVLLNAVTALDAQLA